MQYTMIVIITKFRLNIHMTNLHHQQQQQQTAETSAKLSLVPVERSPGHWRVCGAGVFGMTNRQTSQVFCYLSSKNVAHSFKPIG